MGVEGGGEVRKRRRGRRKRRGRDMVVKAGEGERHSVLDWQELETISGLGEGGERHRAGFGKLKGEGGEGGGRVRCCGSLCVIQRFPETRQSWETSCETGEEVFWPEGAPITARLNATGQIKRLGHWRVA